jgi:hypothetical protein
MTMPYLLRLACLSLACFFAVNLAAGLTVRSFSTRAIRWVERMSARRAARALLFLRFFPAGFALFCVLGLCIPSYVWLEPHAGDEGVGFICLSAAVFGAAMWAISLQRSASAVIHSVRYTRALKSDIVTVPNAGRLVALAGLFRPRILISDEVIAALSDDELNVVLQHEYAHRSSHDNLKQLLILLSPGFGLGKLERAWQRFSEWSADDLAVAGDPRRAADLAAALVSVARLRPTPTPALSTSLIDDNTGLSGRVDRLLQDRPASADRTSRFALITLAVIVVTAPFAPTALAWVHRVLESLMD